MGIKMDSECLLCHLRRNLETARSLGDEETATKFARELVKGFLAMPEDASSPELSPHTARLYQEFYGLSPDRFQKEKDDSNAFVLSRLEEIRQKVEQAEDPILAGLQFDILGNYIDFSALEVKVSFQELSGMLENALTMELDPVALDALCKDLQNGKKHP